METNVAGERAFGGQRSLEGDLPSWSRRFCPSHLAGATFGSSSDEPSRPTAWNLQTRSLAK